jgi:hypothetical protein
VLFSNLDGILASRWQEFATCHEKAAAFSIGKSRQKRICASSMLRSGQVNDGRVGWSWHWESAASRGLASARGGSTLTADLDTGPAVCTLVL